MFAQCVHTKILPNQQQQRLIAKFKICSSLVGSTILHFLVVPVKEFWLFDPWWIPKLRNQPVFGLNPKIPSSSCPLDRFVPCGVEQTNNSYAVSSAGLNFQQQGQAQSDLLVVFIGWMLVFLVGCESWKTKARCQCTKQLGSQNGEDVNQLVLKFQSLRMRELWCNLFFVLPLL